MYLELFPDYPPHDVESHLRTGLKKKTQATFLAKHSGRSIGFVTASIRSDYVEGAKSSPVGYLEAIYVRAEFRRSGVAKKLYAHAEWWVHEKGCTEIGSDTWNWNLNAQEFHLKLGFRKEDVLVHYIKTIATL